MAPHNTQPHFIKIGKLHSSSNLKLRAQYFDQKYGGDCMKAAEISASDDDSAIKSSQYYQRYPYHGYKGFESSDLKPFYMVQEMIEELEIYEHLTSDEEPSDEEEELQPVNLPFLFDVERGLTFKGTKIVLMDSEDDDDDESVSDEAPRRPFARISLEVDDKIESASEVDSDFYIEESEYEDNTSQKGRGSRSKGAKNSKVIYGSIPGIPVGQFWKNRRECSRSSVHVPIKARVHTGSTAGCSIVLSSKEMVQDSGVHFIYKSKAKLNKSNMAKALQLELVGGNKVLENNLKGQIGMRVVRSYLLGTRYAPKKGYRYDGLYAVNRIDVNSIKDGYQIIKVNFERRNCQALPTWDTHCSPDDEIPVHQLSDTELLYTSEDEHESTLSDNRQSPASLRRAAEYALCSRSKLIVQLDRLSASFIEKAAKGLSASNIEKATKVVSVPKKRNKKPVESMEVVSQKCSRSSETSSKKPRKNISKNLHIQSKGARKSARGSSLKQKGSSHPQKGKLLDEKKATSGTKKTSREEKLSEIKQKNKRKKAVSHDKKGKSAQTEAGIVSKRRRSKYH